MSLVNAALRALFDGLLNPVSSLPPIASLVGVSLLAAVAMLLVFKATSNAPRIDAAKRQIQACLFEIRLYNDDLGAILRAQLEMLRHNFTYLRLSAVPMLWTIVPLALVVAQLEFHYGYAPLRPGEEFLVTARLDSGITQSARPAAALEAPDGLEVQTPALWIPSRRELVWRMRAKTRGDYAVSVRVGEQTFEKSVRVAEGVRRRSPLRVASGFWNEFLYPAEDPLPAKASVESIAVAYPEASVKIFRWQTSWLVAFFGLSIVFAFALRHRFGVTM